MHKNPTVLLLMEMLRASTRGHLAGIAKYSRLHGPWTFYRQPLSYLQPYQDTGKSETPQTETIDGIITYITYQKELQSLPAGVPTIIIPFLQLAPGFPNMATSGLSGKMGAEYFLTRGFKNFAFCGFRDIYWSQLRSDYFEQTIRHAGYQTYIYHQSKAIAKSKHLWNLEQQYVVQWLLSLPKPIGIMTCNDDRGQKVLDACRTASLLVPEQVAVLGVDNDDMICEITDPPLSSVAVNFETVGYEAAQLLDKLMKGEKYTNQTIAPVSPTHLVTRQSTDILAVEDQDIASALRFIRHNRNRPIHVNDVVNATTSSRRNLEKKFRHSLNRSILDEIRHARINHMARLLTETDMTITQIALSMGFPDSKHIAELFQKKMGLTPSAYRQQTSPK
jgi:LacI family transcriptional regulator